MCSKERIRFLVLIYKGFERISVKASVPNGIYLERFEPSLEHPPLRARHGRGYISCTSVTKTAGSSSITNKDVF